MFEGNGSVGIPCETLYISNLDENTNVTELKFTLNMLFNQYGKVIKISALKGMKMRGQVLIK